MTFDEYISIHQNGLSSVGTLFPCDVVYSSKWLSTEIAILGFRLNSNMFNIFLTMGMLSYQI